MKPSRAASAKRRAVLLAWRNSPAKPTSPHATKFSASGRSVEAETRARHKPRSAPGSPSLTPPTTDANTSCCERLTPARRSRTASNIAKRPESTPCADRRGETCDGERFVSACTSTNNGRCPSSAGTTIEPGTPARRSARNNLLASGTLRNPNSVISNRPSSLVEPNRCFTARNKRKAWCRSPSNDSTVSTTCSSTRGPARPPSLVTCPTKTIGRSRALASCTRRCAQPRTCATEPGAEFSSGSAIA